VAVTAQRKAGFEPRFPSRPEGEKAPPGELNRRVSSAQATLDVRTFTANDIVALDHSCYPNRLVVIV
jgi:hypothetical protein